MLKSRILIQKIIFSPEDFFKDNTLSVDHDGVMADTKSFVVKKVNETLKTKYTVSDIDSWDWVRDIAIKHGWSQKRASELDKHLWFSAEMLSQVPPTPKAVETIKWFYDKGIEVPVITSRSSNLEQSTLDWYQKHMPFINERNIIISKTDDMRGDYFKVWAIKYLIKPSIHIDDSSDHAEKIITYTKNTVVALMSNSKKLDHHGKSRLIRLLDEDSRPTFHGTREKIMTNPIFHNVAQY